MKRPLSRRSVETSDATISPMRSASGPASSRAMGFNSIRSTVSVWRETTASALDEISFQSPPKLTFVRCLTARASRSAVLYGLLPSYS